VLGIAARVFGVDVQPLTKKMDEVSKFMGRPMLEFNDCVSGVQTAAKSASAAASDVLSEDAHGAVVAQIEEFRDSPDSEAVSQIILPKALEGDALDQLLSTVEELDKAIEFSQRAIAVFPDSLKLQKFHEKVLQHSIDFKNTIKLGRVKFTNQSQNGYGYITPDDGTGDIFFNANYIGSEIFDRLKRGVRVEVHVQYSSKGAFAKKIKICSSTSKLFIILRMRFS
jgi:CspA family cold shock protein